MPVVRQAARTSVGACLRLVRGETSGLGRQPVNAPGPGRRQVGFAVHLPPAAAVEGNGVDGQPALRAQVLQGNFQGDAGVGPGQHIESGQQRQFGVDWPA